MFGFIKKMFSTGLTILSSVNPLNATPFKCVSMTNQKCKGRPQIVNVNSDSDEQVFYPFSIKTSKCSGSCNNINDPNAKMCVPDVVKNETRHTEWHETCKCKCRLHASVCNNKKCWNDNKCRCECK